MVMRVKAKFSDGHIVPLEPLEIEEGAELSVEIDVEPRSSDEEGIKNRTSADGGREGPYDTEVPTINDIFDNIRKSLSHIPKEHGPTDGAKNYKHYLYGHPKEE